jgi:hypothetical protein
MRRESYAGVAATSQPCGAWHRGVGIGGSVGLTLEHLRNLDLLPFVVELREERRVHHLEAGLAIDSASDILHAGTIELHDLQGSKGGW